MDDVLYSIECFRTAPATMSFSAVIDSVEAVEDDQVLIRLLTPSGSFFESLNWLAIVPKALHESPDSDFANNPVGSGAYRLSDRTPGSEIVLEAFDQYYLGQPQIRTVTYKIIPDQSTVAIALETGELDYSKSVSFTSLADFEASDALNVEVRTGNSVMFVFLNTKQAPYDDPLVRRAINLAIDREMCNTVQYEGYGEVATTMLSPTTFGHNESLAGFDYQPEEAAELLAQAGYPDGAGFPPVVIETIDGFGRIAEVVQANLLSIGIQAEIDLQEQNAYTTRALQGGVNFGIMGVGLGGDASSWGVMFQTGGAFKRPGEAQELFLTLVHEIETLGHAMGIVFDEDLGERNLKILEDLDDDSTTSMQRDVQNGGPSEMDGLVHRIVRLADEYGLELPAYRKIIRWAVEQGLL